MNLGNGMLGYKELDSYKSFTQSPFMSGKHTNYFFIYDELLSQLRNQSITFVEIGVLNGGSLYMWRDYFGLDARIIGIDSNPAALKFSNDFEIFIGDQADSNFWSTLFEKIGKIDVVLDDGGHKNEQQIQTVLSCLPFIRDNGMIITEDMHTSFMGDFGNPSRYSFFEFAVHSAKNLTFRAESLKKNHPNTQKISSVTFFESVVAFKINSAASKPGESVNNNKPSNNFVDSRNANLPRFGRIVRLSRYRLAKNLHLIRRFTFFRRLARSLFFTYYRFESLKSGIRLRKKW